jgi:choline dehydrogenase-like flavoprotein
MLVAAPADSDPLARAWFEAAVEAGHPITEDGNGSVTEGVSWTDRNIVEGRRQSAADAYLRHLIDRPNLTIATDAHVSRLVFAPNPLRLPDASSNRVAEYSPQSASKPSSLSTCRHPAITCWAPKP